MLTEFGEVNHIARRVNAPKGNLIFIKTSNGCQSVDANL